MESLISQDRSVVRSEAGTTSELHERLYLEAQKKKKEKEEYEKQRLQREVSELRDRPNTMSVSNVNI
jgi:hypothetical protein